MYLFFDTETTGFKGPFKNRMTQLAFKLIDESENVIKSYESLIKPDGWEIPKEEFFINNNMSTERCEELGKPVFEVLRELQEALKKCKYKIAHNIAFDNRIVLSEIKKAGITHQLFQFKKGCCTMKNNRQLVKALDKRGFVKNPNLNELHKYFFEVGFDGAHDAMVDVNALVKCFFKSVEVGTIQLL